jgi:hypothetical protein
MAASSTPARRVEALSPDLGLVLVGKVDRRVLPALGLAASLPNFDIKAVHVSIDGSESQRVAEEWMRLELNWAPLEIEDVGERSLMTAIEEIVEREVRSRGRVVVIVPELDLDRWWQAVLHRGSGRRIARRLRSLRGVWTVVVPYPAR